jgi:hypothetical protein
MSDQYTVSWSAWHLGKLYHHESAPLSFTQAWDMIDSLKDAADVESIGEPVKVK